MDPKDSIKLGRFLIYSAVFGFFAGVIMSFTPYSGLDNGAIPGVSFLLLIVGIAFCYPTMLEETTGEVSTMRVAIFSIVMVFVLIYVKIGWHAGTFEEFTIDKTWIYILGIALGSKAVQRFGEEEDAQQKHAISKAGKTPPDKG